MNALFFLHYVMRRWRDWVKEKRLKYLFLTSYLSLIILILSTFLARRWFGMLISNHFHVMFLWFESWCVINSVFCFYYYQSYDKQAFHSGTPPPFTGALHGSQNAGLAPSGTGYGPQMYIPAVAPHQQHHSTPLIHPPLHQVIDYKQYTNYCSQFLYLTVLLK